MVTRPDGTSAAVTANRVRSADLAGVGELVQQVAAAWGDGGYVLTSAAPEGLALAPPGARHTA